MAERLVGQRCYVGWPFLVEAMVTRVADGMFEYRRNANATGGGGKRGGGPGVIREPMENYEVKAWPSYAEQLERVYQRRGINTGPVEIILNVRPFKVRTGVGGRVY